MGSKITTSKRTVFLGCFLSATIVLLAPHRLTSHCQYGFRRIFCVPLGISRSLTLSTTQSSREEVSSQDFIKLQQAYKTLESHADHLQALLVQQQETIDRLAKLRVEPQWEKLSFVPAHVFTALSDNHMVINRGQRDGVKTNSFILADNAIVGRVIETAPNQATIKLISDKDAVLPVYIDSPRTSGILRGQGDRSSMAIQKVTFNRPVKQGMAVYASNRPDLRGIPFPVGKVSSCKRDDKDPHLWEIEMMPSVDLSQLDRIDVIIPDKP